jgi:UDP-glucose 4-epimerase
MKVMKNILVTGGAGYIGSHTVISLIENGYNPIIVDDLRNAQASVLSSLEKIVGRKIDYHCIDCCNESKMQALFEKTKMDGIIHFAAYKAVGESAENPLSYYKNNLQSLINILLLSKEFNVDNIVFSSSCTVYGEPEGTAVVDESFPIAKAFSPYGQTKIICEQILNDYQIAESKAKIIALRYFNPVGAHDSGLIGEYPIGKPNNLLPYITQTSIGKLEKLTVFGGDYDTDDGTCIRDYIHVVDLADAHVKALDYSFALKNGAFEAINIGTGKGTTVLEMIKTFEKVANSPLNYTIGTRRTGDVEAIYANPKKAKDLLKWSAQKTLTDSVASAWLWEQNIKKYGY